MGESHRGDGCRRAVGSRREKNGRPIFVDSDGLHELVEAVPMGVPVGGGLVKNPSDRYAIRTRNLQDWNLTVEGAIYEYSRSCLNGAAHKIGQ